MARVGAIEYSEPRNNMVYIRTTPCIICGKVHEFVVRREGYEDWQYGKLIQDALPELDAADRETLISGTCSDCFDELFEESEDNG